jgi:hypothetical protein
MDGSYVLRRGAVLSICRSTVIAVSTRLLAGWATRDLWGGVAIPGQLERASRHATAALVPKLLRAQKRCVPCSGRFGQCASPRPSSRLAPERLSPAPLCPCQRTTQSPTSARRPCECLVRLPDDRDCLLLPLLLPTAGGDNNNVDSPVCGCVRTPRSSARTLLTSTPHDDDGGHDDSAPPSRFFFFLTVLTNRIPHLAAAAPPSPP